MTRTITFTNANGETLYAMPTTTDESTIHFREGLAISDVSFIEVTDITPTSEVWRLHWTDEITEG